MTSKYASHVLNCQREKIKKMIDEEVEEEEVQSQEDELEGESEEEEDTGDDYDV